MAQFFRDTCRRAARTGGWGGLVRLALRAVLDLARSAPGVHMEILQQDYAGDALLMACAQASPARLTWLSNGSPKGSKASSTTLPAP